MPSKTFCIYPFTGLSTRQDGAIKACYRSHPIGYIQENTLEEVWNSSSLCRLRQQLLNNERPPECDPCFSLEDIGVESLRQRHLSQTMPESRSKLYPDTIKKLNEDFTMPFDFPVLEIKLNNLCNLKCRMCNPTDSTSWTDWAIVEDFYKADNDVLVDTIKKFNLIESPVLDNFENNPNWWDSFKKIIPHLKKVEFAGGEPLIDPQHYRILEMLSTYGMDIELRYSTNLTTLGKGGRNVWEYWPKFKNVAVNVSIDGIEDSYEYIRSNASWKTLIENIKTIQQIPNVTRVVGIVAAQVSNVLVFDKMIEYFLNDLGITFYITNIVRHPTVLSPQVLPPELKILAIERLTAIKEKVPSFNLVKEAPLLHELTITHIDSLISFLLANDTSHLWDRCVEFNHKLDKSRHQLSFEQVTPEFKNYIK